MSLKPTKKTDLNKGWLKSRDARDISVSISPEYHLIISDGTNTEPKYFEAIKKEIDSKFKDRIDLDIKGTGKNTVSLFYKAKTKADRSGNVFKHVWIVYDTDDFTHEHINQTAELCAKYSSDETTYHAIWSNQCIELWFLLHFEYFQSDIHRKEYWPKLTEQLKKLGLGEYKKNRDDMYDILKPFINTAIANAKKLADINKGKTPADSAPGTEVYQIIEKLKPYLNL